MSNCTRFKEAREKLGLSQMGVTKHYLISIGTIYKLEKDESYYSHMSTKIADEVQRLIDDSIAGKISKSQYTKVEKKTKPVTVVKETKVEPKIETVHKPIKKTDELTEQDSKTLTLIEFAYEGLKESKNDSDFVANITLMKKILSKY